MRITLFKIFILLLIHYYKPHGYELMKQVRMLSRGLLKPGPGTMYPLLFLLKHQKLIREISGDGRRKRYELTSKGIEVLRGYLPKFREMLLDLLKIVEEETRRIGLD